MNNTSKDPNCRIEKRIVIKANSADNKMNSIIHERYN